MEILSLGSKHPTKFIGVLLDKVSKTSALRSNKCSKGNLLLLNGSKGALEVGIVKRGWLRGRTRSYLTRIRGSMMGCRLNNLVITGYLIKVSPVKYNSIPKNLVIVVTIPPMTILPLVLIAALSNCLAKE